MERTYYTVVLYETDRWCIHFGSYSRSEAVEEMHHMRDAGETAKLLVTGHRQRDIDERLAQLNKG